MNETGSNNHVVETQLCRDLGLVSALSIGVGTMISASNASILAGPRVTLAMSQLGQVPRGCVPSSNHSDEILEQGRPISFDQVDQSG